MIEIGLEVNTYVARIKKETYFVKQGKLYR